MYAQKQKNPSLSCVKFGVFFLLAIVSVYLVSLEAVVYQKSQLSLEEVLDEYECVEERKIWLQGEIDNIVMGYDGIAAQLTYSESFMGLYDNADDYLGCTVHLMMKLNSESQYVAALAMKGLSGNLFLNYVDVLSVFVKSGIIDDHVFRTGAFSPFVKGSIMESRFYLPRVRVRLYVLCRDQTLSTNLRDYSCGLLWGYYLR